MSESHAETGGSKAAASQPKPRNPVERAIVWGLIGAMTVVIGIEYRAKSGYEGTIEMIRVQLGKDGGTALPMKEARALFGGGPSETEIRRNSTNQFIELKWFSLFKDYRLELMVEMDDENPMLISYSTPNVAIEEVAPVVDASQNGSDFTPTMGAGGMGGGGMGAGGMGAGAPMGPPQTDGGFGGTGSGGAGGGGSRQPRGVFGLALFEQISSELKITPEQTQKLTTAAEELAPDFSVLRDLPDAEARRAFFEENRRKAKQAVQEILDETQFARIRQLDLQQSGPTAIERPEIVEAIGLSEEQAGQVAELAEAVRSIRRRGFGGGETSPAEPQLTREEIEAQILAVLSDEQKAKWTELLGPEGTLPPAGGGRGGADAGGPGGPGGQPPVDGNRPRRPEAEE